MKLLCSVGALLAFTLLFSSATAERKNWALLIAGSNEYYNYRHQADICHAYQIMHKGGIPDEQIVVMMYDDIASSSLNPVQGNIINRPGGPNVYPGVLKDYTKGEVNATTFLKVLQGDSAGIEKLLGRKGKVINSGPEDYVFVYFADHGGPGILGMPNPPYLKARDVNQALIQMNKDKKFAKLTFYVEACESGSIFADLLPKDINVYVTTAANPTESSWGCYCENDRNTCLGDTYSVKWMENTDAVNIHTETLETQFEIVKKETPKSHVQQYGDLDFTSLTIDQFIASNNKTAKRSYEIPALPAVADYTQIPTDQVGIHTLQSMLKSNDIFYTSKREEISAQLGYQMWIQEQTTKTLTEIAGIATRGRGLSNVLEQRSKIYNWDCYESAVDLLVKLCPRLEPSVNDFVLRKLNSMVNLCNTLPYDVVSNAVIRATKRASICK